MKKSTLLPMLALGLVVALMSARHASDGYKVGDVVQDFNLKSVDGKTVSLTDKDTKGYIIEATLLPLPATLAP